MVYQYRETKAIPLNWRKVVQIKQCPLGALSAFLMLLYVPFVNIELIFAYIEVLEIKTLISNNTCSGTLTCLAPPSRKTFQLKWKLGPVFLHANLVSLEKSNEAFVWDLKKMFWQVQNHLWKAFILNLWFIDNVCRSVE